jgi:hypothetical protein
LVEFQREKSVARDITGGHKKGPDKLYLTIKEAAEFFAVGAVYHSAFIRHRKLRALRKVSA